MFCVLFKQVYLLHVTSTISHNIRVISLLVKYQFFNETPFKLAVACSIIPANKQSLTNVQKVII